MVYVAVAEGDEETVIFSNNCIAGMPMEAVETHLKDFPMKRARFLILERMVIEKLGSERYQWDETFLIPVKALDGSQTKTVSLISDQSTPNNQLVMLLCYGVERICHAINVIFWSNEDKITITLHTK